LNEKIPAEEMKDALFSLFKSYGNILQIIVKKNLKMKG
jgi:hypothetical protein